MSDSITINFQRGGGRPQGMVLALGATIQDLLASAGLGRDYSVLEDGEPVDPAAPVQASRTYTAAPNTKAAFLAEISRALDQAFGL